MALIADLNPELLIKDEEELEFAILIRLWLNKSRRRFWVKPWLSRRTMHGQYDTLFQELDRESELIATYLQRFYIE